MQFRKLFMQNRRPRRFLKRAGEGACSTYILVHKLCMGIPHLPARFSWAPERMP